MANVPFNEARRLHSVSILLAAGLTLIFGSVSALLASVTGAPSLMLLSSVLAFLAVGFVTLRLRSAAQPADAALGAGGAVLLVSSLQLAFAPELSREVPVSQIAMSLLVSVLFAVSLAWVGGRLGGKSRSGVSPSRRWSASKLAEPSASRRFGAQGPSSQPAPRSS